MFSDICEHPCVIFYRLTMKRQTTMQEQTTMKAHSKLVLVEDQFVEHETLDRYDCS